LLLFNGILSLDNLDMIESVYLGKGLASMYRPWEKSKTVPYARYAGAWNTLPTSLDLVCAHRSLPFGTVLRISYKNRVSYCAVFDRGPYGYCEPSTRRSKQVGCPKGYRYKVTVKGKNGWYRGMIDATPSVFYLLRSQGWVTVNVERLKLPLLKEVLRVQRSLAFLF